MVQLRELLGSGGFAEVYKYVQIDGSKNAKKAYAVKEACRIRESCRESLKACIIQVKFTYDSSFGFARWTLPSCRSAVGQIRSCAAISTAA